jgi:hypothetical protein
MMCPEKTPFSEPNKTSQLRHVATNFSEEPQRQRPRQTTQRRMELTETKGHSYRVSGRLNVRLPCLVGEQVAGLLFCRDDLIVPASAQGTRFGSRPSSASPLIEVASQPSPRQPECRTGPFAMESLNWPREERCLAGWRRSREEEHRSALQYQFDILFSCNS